MATLAAKKGNVVVAEKMAAPVIRSKRGLARRGMDTRVLTPLEQIPVRPGGTTGPWAYYIRPEGATIKDALICYPNGAKLPASEDRRGAYSMNADHFQALMRDKGYEYVGATLTPDGIRRLVEVLAQNKGDEILDLEEQIQACAYDIENSDEPKYRDGQRKRKTQLERRMEYVTAPVDPDAMIAELEEIARAQRMANVSPEVLQVMREMLGAQDAKIMQLAAHFQPGSEPGHEVLE